MDEKKPSVNVIEELLADRSFKKLRAIFKVIEVADLSEILAELDIVSCIVLFRLIAKDRRSEVFSYLPFAYQAKLLHELPDLVSASLLNQMEPVDRTQLLQDLPFEIREKLILELQPEQMQMTWQMLSYKSNTVGRLMSPEFFSIPSGMSVQDALAAIRWSGNRIPENLLNQIFIVDLRGRLLGHVNLSSLVLADPATILVDDLMDKNFVTLNVGDDRRRAVDVFRKYDRPYIPVMDNDGLMIGLVEAEDVFDVAEEEATDDIQAFGGQSSLPDSYFKTSFLLLLKKRGGWLGLIFAFSWLSVKILQQFFHETNELESLLLFMPMILAAGGMAGSQAAALSLRGLAVREIGIRDGWSLLLRESGISLTLGACLALLIFGFSFYIEGLNQALAFALSFLVICNVFLGALIGSGLPFLMRRFRLHPAIASAPVIAAIMDVLGLFILLVIVLIRLQSVKMGAA